MWPGNLTSPATRIRSDGSCSASTWPTIFPWEIFSMGKSSIDGFSIAMFGYRSLFFHVCKLANETSILKLLMLENVLKLVSVVLQRARNNLYGWGCPLYCSQPSLSTLLLTFLLGLLLGLFLASFGLGSLDLSLFKSGSAGSSLAWLSPRSSP